MPAHQQPLFVGIAGGTGSGKSTVAQKVAEGLPQSGVVTLDHDSYYRDLAHLSGQERAAVNFDHPDSLDNDLFIEHLDQLRRGHAIDVPRYDFRSHRRSAQTRRIEPAPVVVVEGILVFVEKRVRDLLDIKIFVDTDADIRVFRRIERDVQDRGRSLWQVRDQYYNTVRPMHLQFVEPSKRWADLIIPEGGNNQVALDMVLGKLISVAETRLAEREALEASRPSARNRAPISQAANSLH